MRVFSLLLNEQIQYCIIYNYDVIMTVVYYTLSQKSSHLSTLCNFLNS